MFTHKAYKMQREGPGDWTLWELCQHTGDKKDCIERGAYQKIKATKNRLESSPSMPSMT